MQNLIIENIPRQIRYKLATLDSGEHYLIDGDYPFITIFFPTLSPHLYKKCYPIDEELYQQLRGGAQSSSLVTLSMGAIIGLSFFGRALAKMTPEDMFVLPNLETSFTLLIVGLALLTALRIYYKLKRIPVRFETLEKPKKMKLQMTDRDEFVVQLLVLVIFVIMISFLLAIVLGEFLHFSAHIFVYMNFFFYFYASNIMFLVRGNYNVLDEK